MYNVPIDEDRVNDLVVEVLKDWFLYADTDKLSKALREVIKYGTTEEDFKRWKSSMGL